MTLKRAHVAALPLIAATMAVAGCTQASGQAAAPQMTVTQTVQSTPAAEAPAPEPTATKTAVVSVTHVTEVVEQRSSVGSYGSPSNWCSGGVGVNGNTSCPFAQNVASALRNSSRGSHVLVYAHSPVTGRTYSMNCYANGSGHVCMGGNNAKVWVS